MCINMASIVYRLVMHVCVYVSVCLLIYCTSVFICLDMYMYMIAWVVHTCVLV